jgi:hypothetical protein
LKLTDADPPYNSAEIGTPRDYSSDTYRVYFEVSDPHGTALKIITDFLGAHRTASMVVLAHGYETELPIQCVPDIVRMLSAENIAVYQVVRYAKSGGVWA